MNAPLVRPVVRADYDQWLPLWDGYNAFYGRHGATALDPAITATTWERFFNEGEPVRALVAELGGKLVGLTHYLFHRSTRRSRRSATSRTCSPAKPHAVTVSAAR